MILLPQNKYILTNSKFSILLLFILLSIFNYNAHYTDD